MAAYSIKDNPWILTCMIIIAIFITFDLIFLIILNFQMIKIIKSSTTLIEKTKHLQIMLYKAVFYKSIFVLCSLMLPMTIMFLCTSYVIKSLYIGIIAIAIIPMHAPISYVFIIMRIRPYQEAVFNYLKLGKYVSKCKSNTRVFKPVDIPSIAVMVTTKTAVCPVNLNTKC